MTADPLELIAGPAAEPATLAELKAAARVNTGAAEDGELARMLTAARELFERAAQRPVLPTRFRQHCRSLAGIGLRAGPCLSVDRVEYQDAAGDWHELEGVRLTRAGARTALWWPAAVELPPLNTEDPYPVRVEFTAGWAAAGVVPAAVKTAILLAAAHLYRNRESHTDSAFEAREVPLGFGAVAAHYFTGLDWGA